MSENKASEYDRLDAKAQATKCGIDGCDGTEHEWVAPPEQWHHRVLHAEFDGRSVLFDIIRDPNGKYIGNMSMESEPGDMTAAELRADADLWTSYPGWLRHLADKLDALNS